MHLRQYTVTYVNQMPMVDLAIVYNDAQCAHRWHTLCMLWHAWINYTLEENEWKLELLRNGPDFFSINRLNRSLKKLIFSNFSKFDFRSVHDQKNQFLLPSCTIRWFSHRMTNFFQSSVPGYFSPVILEDIFMENVHVDPGCFSFLYLWPNFW